MIEFERWLANPHASDLLQRMKDRANGYARSLVDPTLGDSETLKNVRLYQGHMQAIQFVETLILQSRQAREDHKNGQLE
jgi:hypothetical protein